MKEKTLKKERKRKIGRKREKSKKSTKENIIRMKCGSVNS